MFSTLTVSQLSENRKAGEPAAADPGSPQHKAGACVGEPGARLPFTLTQPPKSVSALHYSPSALTIFLNVAVNVMHTATFQEKGHFGCILSAQVSPEQDAESQPAYPLILTSASSGMRMQNEKDKFPTSLNPSSRPFGRAAPFKCKS